VSRAVITINVVAARFRAVATALSPCVVTLRSGTRVATNTAFDDTPTPLGSIADRIWPASSVTPSQEWVDLLASRHGADVSTTT